jgi:RimJ/RimL family protein N-acetyltransferase
MQAMRARDRTADMHLETARLVLRQFAEQDADWLADLHGNPEVMRYIDDGQPVARSVVTGEELPAILRDYPRLPAGLGRYVAQERQGGAPVGWFGLRPPSSIGLLQDEPGVLELGYRLFPAFWGRGYATEGARALVSLAFAKLGAHRVVATTMTVNAGSRRVMEKAGLSLVRTFFEEWPGYIEGAELGDVEYAVTRQDWLTSQAGADARR